MKVNMTKGHLYDYVIAIRSQRKRAILYVLYYNAMQYTTILYNPIYRTLKYNTNEKYSIKKSNML